MLIFTFVTLLLISPVKARDNGLGLTPLLGWNTWCTQNSCGVDWCSSAEVLSVAQTIKDVGLLDIGWNYINLDDCWGVRDNKTKQIMADPTRFPEGMPAFISKIHDMGFKFGLYTDWGELACHSPFVGSFPYFEQDAKTFASWQVDLVKLDSCHLPANYTGEQLTKNMSQAMDKSGRTMWLYFHCWGTQTCGTYGNSFRIAPDHHDNWNSTASVMQTLLNPQSYWGVSDATHGWPDLDFVFTGGEGCGLFSQPGVRCPGQTDEEYISEFTVWAVATGQLIFATDPRNMSAIQKKILFNREVLAIFNDTSGFADIKMVGTTEAMIWARPLVTNTAAVAFHNPLSIAQDITVDFSTIPARKWGGATLHMRDVWQQSDLGLATGHFTVLNVPPHGVRLIKLSQ